MKTRDVIGRKIVGVVQERVHTGHSFQYDINRIELDNGKAIVFCALEAEYGDHIVTGDVFKMQKSDLTPR